jgi:hypothetical protein
MANTANKNQRRYCVECSELVSPRRADLGYCTCLDCGDRQAHDARRHWTIAPVHKSNYMLITDRALLSGLNNKGGNVK